jgi:hypothetical protein
MVMSIASLESEMLRRELGLSGLARFLRICRNATGAYTHDPQA